MVNYKDKLEKMRATIPLTDEVECKECKGKFYDEFNLLCLATLDYCIRCSNRKLDKETIERKYQNVR